MLTLPTPPTDSVYKFGFITGFLMFAMGLSLPGYIEQEKLNTSYKIKKEYMDKWQEFRIKVADINVRDKWLDNDAKVRSDNHSAQYQQFLEKVDKESKIRDSEIAETDRILKDRIMYLEIGAFAGFMLAITCGTFWYLRIQRYQDRLLLAQVKEAEEKLNGKSSVENSTRRSKT